MLDDWEMENGQDMLVAMTMTHGLLISMFDSICNNGRLPSISITITKKKKKHEQICLYLVTIGVSSIGSGSGAISQFRKYDDHLKTYAIFNQQRANCIMVWLGLRLTLTACVG